MILLRPDCLVFKTSSGENIPCSAHAVTVELIGESAALLDKEVIEHAAESVLHYFRVEKGQNTVSVAEFSDALERALRGLGLDVKAAHAGAGSPAEQTAASAAPAPRVIETDLQELAGESDLAYELAFFPRLRETIQRGLDGSPLVLRFRGLRPCVKQLVGAKRWGAGCQSLNDQIVEYLRHCLDVEKTGSNCALVVW
jgi:hypothetical protein